MRPYAVLAAISGGYPPRRGRSATCSSPVRHSMLPKKHPVRLACIRHAASVYPEPGSNSQSKRPIGVSTTPLRQYLCGMSELMPAASLASPSSPSAVKVHLLPRRATEGDTTAHI